jgi:choline dehydrogenase-like flavoprotein
VAINAALTYPNVHLLTNRRVEKLVTNSNGKKVKSVEATYFNTPEKYEADTVILSCGAINSAALLLRSKNDQHPHGLGNSSGLVGRNLMLHNNGTLVAITPRKNAAVFQKSILLTDYYHGAPNSKYPLGSIQLMGKTDPDTLKSELEDLHTDSLFKDAQGALDLEYYAQHSIDFFLTSEDLPKKQNRVITNGVIQLNYTPNNLEAYHTLKSKLIDLCDQIGMRYSHSKDTIYAGYKLGVSGVSHQSGTCRFGQDPKESVLDLHCRLHDVDNVYVVDTSFFPSSGAVNPALTVIANALRVGHHLNQN